MLKNQQSETEPERTTCPTDPLPGTDKAKGRVALTGLLAPSLYAFEWWLVGVTGTLVSFLKYRGLSDIVVWLVLWGLNLLYSSAVVLFNDHLHIDITLMETLRRLTNATAGRSRWAGYLMELALFIRLLLWDGPCRLLIYFREKIPSQALRGFLFVGASGFQMFVWAKLYVLGYESVSDFLKVLG